MTNLTHEQKLVEKLPISGILSGGKPVGREGFEVIVMEHISTGWRYYCTLGPGDMLRLSERLFGSFSAHVVDIRPARQLDIHSKFPTANPLIVVTVQAKVLYRVTDPYLVAIEVEDSLAKFQDRIVGSLRREIIRMSHVQISEMFCESVITSVGAVSHFGLAVEGVGFLTVGHDDTVMDHMRQRARLDYEQGLGSEVAEFEHHKQLRKQYQDKELDFREHQYQMLIDSQQKMNDRMQAVLDEYLRRNPDADPEELRRQVRATFEEVSDRPRITFGSGTSIGQPSRRISFGQTIEGHTLPPPQQNTSEEDKEDDDEGE